MSPGLYAFTEIHLCKQGTTEPRAIFNLALHVDSGTDQNKKELDRLMTVLSKLKGDLSFLVPHYLGDRDAH